MRWLPTIGVATLLGCVSPSPDPLTAARRHAANVQTAQQEGYQIVERSDKTQFCATAAPVGSHVVPPCEAEADWEIDQLWVWRGGPAWPGLNGQSGHSPASGTLGY
jgi:hypothetical protein